MSKSVAIPEARRRSRSPVPTSAAGFCKREVRECFRVPVSRSADATQAWQLARHKHHEDDPARIPRGVPVFWLGGSEGHGHVSISTGAGGHWTTDLIRAGWFDRTGIARVSRTWTSLRLAGWTEDLDGVRLWRDGATLPPRIFTLAADELDAAGDVVHEIDDREAAFARHFGEHTYNGDDLMGRSALAWLGASDE